MFKNLIPLGFAKGVSSFFSAAKNYIMVAMLVIIMALAGACAWLWTNAGMLRAEVVQLTNDLDRVAGVNTGLVAKINSLKILYDIGNKHAEAAKEEVAKINSDYNTALNKFNAIRNSSALIKDLCERQKSTLVKKNSKLKKDNNRLSSELASNTVSEEELLLRAIDYLNTRVPKLVSDPYQGLPNPFVTEPIIKEEKK